MGSFEIKIGYHIEKTQYLFLHISYISFVYEDPLNAFDEEKKAYRPPQHELY